MLGDAPEMLHQPIELIEGWPAGTLHCFANKTKLPENGEGVVELLAGEGIPPCRPRNLEEVGEVREAAFVPKRRSLIQLAKCPFAREGPDDPSDYRRKAQLMSLSAVKQHP